MPDVSLSCRVNRAAAPPPSRRAIKARSLPARRDLDLFNVLQDALNFALHSPSYLAPDRLIDSESSSCSLPLQPTQSLLPSGGSASQPGAEAPSPTNSRAARKWFGPKYRFRVDGNILPLGQRWAGRPQLECALRVSAPFPLTILLNTNGFFLRLIADGCIIRATEQGRLRDFPSAQGTRTTGARWGAGGKAPNPTFRGVETPLRVFLQCALDAWRKQRPGDRNA